jgi:hypothetical protein
VAAPESLSLSPPTCRKSLQRQVVAPSYQFGPFKVPGASLGTHASTLCPAAVGDEQSLCDARPSAASADKRGHKEVRERGEEKIRVDGSDQQQQQQQQQQQLTKVDVPLSRPAPSLHSRAPGNPPPPPPLLLLFLLLFLRLSAASSGTAK